MIKKIPDDFSYLEGEDRLDYLNDMMVCQEYAGLNREIIIHKIMKHFNLFEHNNYEHFETIHNYIDLDTNIVRKGAIDASKGKKLLIPLNMRDGCIVGVGKGNADWNYSAPHGAGRLMSRTKAKEEYDLDEFEGSMKGVYTTSVKTETIDECPMVYKDSKEIADAISDTVDILEIIKPIYNYKNSD